MQGILSSMVTNGLARSALTATPQGTLLNMTDARRFLPLLPNNVFGRGDSLWGVHGTNTSKMTKFTMHTTTSGYGYWYESTTVRLAIAVFIAYCACVTAPICSTVMKGAVIMSWQSIIELVA